MKRTKVLFALSACILCLGLLAFAVYATVTSTIFNLNGTINFNPEGAYVDIQGKVLRGSSKETLTELIGENFTYNDRNYDDSTGIASGNFTMESWSPEVAFLPLERFIQYQVTITNKSSEPITAIPSNIAPITDVSTVEEVSDILRIESNESKTYKLTLESTGDTAITDAQVALNFDIRTTSAYVEEQTSLGAVTFDVTFPQDTGVITAVNNDNSTSSSASLQKAVFIPKTVDGSPIDTYGNGSVVSLSTAIKYVIFEADITSIGTSAFQNCSSLINIAIPSSVTSIGASAFSGCISLKSIKMPSDITSIESSTFNGCSSLTYIEIPSGVASIGNSAFNGCSSIENIAIPNSVTSIGASAFNACTSLKSINIPSSVTSIENSAFKSCTSLNSVTFEEESELISIENSTFDYCILLKSIEIPSRVISIGNNAFNYCSSLETVTFEEGSKLVSIGDQAFNICMSLKNIEIPYGVVSIGEQAFNYCTSLESIEIPSSVILIEKNAFYDCSSLTSLIINTQSGKVWQRAWNSSFSVDLSTVDLSDPSQNATWFTKDSSEGYYSEYYWRQG